MKNLKLNAKLMASFGLVFLVMIVCAIVAILNMNRLSGQIDHWSALFYVERVWEMRRNMVAAEREMLAAIHAKDQNQVDSYLSKAEEEAQGIFSALDAFEQATRIDKETITKLRDSFNAILPVHQQIAELLKKGAWEQASTVFETDYVPLFEKGNEFLLDTYDLQSQLVAADKNETDLAVRHGEMILIATVVVALAVALFSMSMLKRAILTPVKEINQAAKAIAKGISAQGWPMTGQMSLVSWRKRSKHCYRQSLGLFKIWIMVFPSLATETLGSRARKKSCTLVILQAYIPHWRRSFANCRVPFLRLIRQPIK